MSISRLIRNGILLISLMVPSVNALSGSQFEISGLIDDQTISRFGHVFYEELIKGWEVPNNVTIVLREFPDAVVGNVVWIEVNDETVFRDKIGTRQAGIEEKAQAARALLEVYLKKKKEALQGLEVY